ncbi:SPFH domain-containing protein [Aminipila butyrica]|uniref:SPFH domain-containing protein n=1 Tax=Aminipila butyrica TaxID=433296 RepID=A0A858BUH0_9FIRM|nr:SPFH domain-containing protein [Aminipila butyrica]QIB69691.1 SPFH domain-containing protein [Aminipila butyrica]
MAIVEVVKYDGSPNVLAWKFPNAELGTWTQVIVNESQEAVLYKGGQALDWFGPGRHTLDTANIPILNNLVNLPFGGRSPFSAEVWYVNKVNSLDVKWGTPTPIQLQDPKYNVFVPIRAFGQFGIKISDAKLFLTKLVGTLPGFSSADIVKYFRGIYLTKVKDDISEYIINKKISVLEINAYISEISESLMESILPNFSEFGIELVNFYVNDISVPEEDSAVVKLKAALAKKAEMDILGYSYTQERSFDTLEGAATNPGSGSAPLMGAGLGLGMGVGLGGNFGGALGEMGKNLQTNPLKECPHCRKQIGLEYNFCPFCGKDTNPTMDQKVCPKCGASNHNGLKFCGQCGNSLIKSCPKCGESVDDKQKFCPHCGNPLVKKCDSCGSELGDNLKFCPECGKKVEGERNE